MKRQRREQPEQPEIPGLRAAMADIMAEALMMHFHQCVARRAAVAQLALMGVTEEQFLIDWADGAYDG